MRLIGMAEELVFRIPSKLKEFMDSFPDIKWSEFAKSAVFSEYKRCSLSKHIHRIPKLKRLDESLKQLSKEYIDWELTRGSDDETVEFKVPWYDKTKNIGEFPDVDWSRVVTDVLDDKFKRVLLFRSLNDILKHSKLTEEDALRLGDELKERVAKRHGLM